MSEIKTRHLFRIALQVGPPQVIGSTPYGERRIVPVPEGEFEGERLRGVVLNGGSDWILVRLDHSGHSTSALYFRRMIAISSKCRTEGFGTGPLISSSRSIAASRWTRLLTIFGLRSFSKPDPNVMPG
jgi:Protein of unknown function (DUF3237)